MLTENDNNAQPPGPAAAERTAPSPAAVEAALRTLSRAWAPSTPLPGDPVSKTDVDDGDDWDGCGCAGETEDGRPVCNCAADCGCEACTLYRHTRQKWCSAGSLEGIHCGLPTRYRVVAYRLWPQWVRDESEGATCPHTGDHEPCMCTRDTVFLSAGLQPAQHRYFTSCSVAHAQAIITRIQQQDGHSYGDDERRLRCAIERWTYVPHDLQLPSHLVALRDLVGNAQRSVATLIDWHARDQLDAEFWMKGLRAFLARAAWHVAHPEQAPEPEPEPDDGLSAPQEEPEPDGPEA